MVLSEKAILARLILVATSKTVLRLLAVSSVAGWTVAFIFFMSTWSAPRTGDGFGKGGDFIAFYSAARIVWTGNGDRLYDLAYQRQVQGDVLGSPPGPLCAFVYPAYLAVAISPLALLPYPVAYVIVTLFLCGALALSLALMKPHLPMLRNCWGIVAGVSFAFYPMCATVTGGQTPALTVLLLAAAFHFLQTGRQAWAGVALGLLLFKPQLAAFVLMLLLARGQWRCALTAGGVAIAEYLVAAGALGASWPREMAGALARYWPLEDAANGRKSISLLGWSQHVLPDSFWKPVGLVLCGLLFVAVLWSWRRTRPGNAGFALDWSVAVAATVLLSPHSQWYELGVLLLPFWLALDWRLRPEVQARSGLPTTLSALERVMLAGAFVLAPFYDNMRFLGWQPLILVAILLLGWICRLRMSGAGLEPGGCAPGSEDSKGLAARQSDSEEIALGRSGCQPEPVSAIRTPAAAQFPARQ